MAGEQVRLALTERRDDSLTSHPASRPALLAWVTSGSIQLGEPGPIDGGPTAGRFDGNASAATACSSTKFWSITATARLPAPANAGPRTVRRSGVIAAVTDDLLGGPVRALVVRDGKLGVLAWSWRGGMALWPTHAEFPTGRWAHAAATFGPNGDLELFVDGELARVFAVQELWAGRSEWHTVTVGGKTTFDDRDVPGWDGLLQDVSVFDGPVAHDRIRQLARDALGLAEPTPERPPVTITPLPERRGCDDWSHQPAWRRAGADVVCVVCDPPRGCEHDSHQAHWRPAAGWDMRSTFVDLECGLCIETARRSVAAETAAA